MKNLLSPLAGAICACVLLGSIFKFASGLEAQPNVEIICSGTANGGEVCVQWDIWIDGSFYKSVDQFENYKRIHAIEN